MANVCQRRLMRASHHNKKNTEACSHLSYPW